jgi:hypothetical protein
MQSAKQQWERTRAMLILDCGMLANSNVALGKTVPYPARNVLLDKDILNSN